MPTDAFTLWPSKWNITDTAGRPLTWARPPVGSGWLPLLDRLVTDLVALGWDRRLVHVGEKFGQLVFDIDTTSKLIQDRVRRAELESAATCEVCGAPGSLHRPEPAGWAKTLCEEHRRQRESGTWPPRDP